MYRRLVMHSGWIVAAVALALSGARWARGQGTFPEGAFVRAQDGSVWVVSNGVRIGIAPAADSGNTLAGLRMAGSASTFAELSDALAALSTPPAPAPANPAETLVGQRATVCSYGVPIDIEVARVEWTKTVIGNSAPGNAMWIVAFIDVTNQGTKNESLYGPASARVVDERGREFDWREYPPDPVDLARAYGVKGWFEPFSPGITEQSVAVFQVPENVQRLTLVGKSIGPACP
jgi:hypothetical protein